VPHRLGERRGVSGRPGKPELELRLDERDRIGGERDLHAVELWNRGCQAEVRDIEGDDLDDVRDDAGVEVTEVRRFEVDDARVLAERPEQLTVSRIDGVDAACARGEEDAGEAPGCRAHVERDTVADLDSEGGERSKQLRLAAQLLPVPEDDRRSLGDERRGVREQPPADENASLANDLLGIPDVRVGPHELVPQLAQAPTALATQDRLLSDAWSGTGVVGGARARRAQRLSVRG